MTDWKSALGDLTRRSPSERVMRSVVDAMRGSADDRSAAILAATFADIGLVAGISGFICPNQASIAKAFWDKNAKYRTFSSRIDKASSMGIIGPITTANLDVIRAVRNAFAHAMCDLDFRTAEIEIACKKLVVSDNARFFVELESDRKYRFLYCYACDDIFRKLFGFSGLLWITGQRMSNIVSQILP